MGIFLDVEPLEEKHGAGQLGQFLGTLCFCWFCVHLGHCVDFQLQGFPFSSFLESLLPINAGVASSLLQHLGELMISSWWHRGLLCDEVLSVGGGINRQSTCLLSRLRGDGSTSSSV